MIESIAQFPSIHLRHRNAPLLRERDQYLSYLLQMGLSPDRVRTAAAYLIHVVRIMELDSMRDVEWSEVEEASERWVTSRADHPRNQGQASGATPKNFRSYARKWLTFHGSLIVPKPSGGSFDHQLKQFESALESHWGLASSTVGSYTKKARHFLAWASHRQDDLSSISIKDVDEFLAEKRKSGCQTNTIATQCRGLRAFFQYAEERGWCRPGIWRGILSPRIPTYTDHPKGPTWPEVRRLIRSVDKSTPVDLRARAMLLLFSIYGLRSSEVAGLRLDDFDWRNETFTVRRAKRGGIQQYPIQYEVGEAILQYLQHGRPRSNCRHVFLTVQLPYRPLGPVAMWCVVGKRMRSLKIECTHNGPHSLRHACATYLLSKGSSYKDIAGFLGHKGTHCVGIYAKFDERSLKKIAKFSLSGLR